jgi:hypothetical protein
MRVCRVEGDDYLRAVVVWVHGATFGGVSYWYCMAWLVVHWITWRANVIEAITVVRGLIRTLMGFSTAAR